MTQVRVPYGNTDKYMARHNYAKKHGDGLAGAMLFILGVAVLIAIGTAL